jgi:DNA helicase-2/ATP-dependent DNA helicase PcrA
MPAATCRGWGPSTLSGRSCCAGSEAGDQLDVVRQAVRDNNLDEKKFPPSVFAGLIERAKRDGISVEGAAIAAGWLSPGKAGAVGKAYAEALSAAGAVDFADLIRLPVRLLRESPESLAAVRSEVRHLLVDEFQDVDAGQAALAGMIAAGAESFCAVGDEDQSIYGWRGGSAASMLSFERDYPGACVLRLDTNYRTKAAILAAAGSVIGRNRLRREKRIAAARAGGEPPCVRLYPDADAEADGTAGAVAEEIRRGTSPAEVAVFYRVNAQSRPIEDALRRLGIPYVLRGALSFYDRASVRDAMAYLKWFVNPEDPVSLKRLLKSPRRGVGEGSLSRARESAKLSGRPFSAALADIPGLASLFALRGTWLESLPGRRVGAALRILLDEAGYLAWLADRLGDDGPRGPGGPREDLENVQELLRLADASPGSGEEGVRGFLETMSLSPKEAGREDAAAVRLMTLHNAKGLEFDSVYLVGLEEGLLPHSRSADSDAEVEEERRLFYVGLTRAREKAVLSFVRRRLLFGSYREAAPSRFLSEVPPSLLRWDGDAAASEGRRPAPSRGPLFGGGADSRWRSASPAVSRLEQVTVSVRRGPAGGRAEITAARSASGYGRAAGLRPDGLPAKEAQPGRPRAVRHPVFGDGRVEAVEGEGADRKIVARFPGYGVKKILVRAVRMEILD